MSTIKKDGLTKQFNYYQKGERATTLVASETFGKNNFAADKLSYTYDKKGNITEIRQNGELVARYEYDSLNRLVREDNRPLNKSYFITYDTAGNIVEKKESAFTLGLFDTVEKTTASKYVYADNGVKDRLLSFNGENIEYDALGNPTTYRDYNLTWSHVNRLAKFNNVNFQYNYAGTRLFKTVGAKKTKYYCDGSKVIAQDDGTDMLYFYYGTEGVTAFKYKGVVYHYKKDMLGNILGIYDGNSQLLVKYVYDAWGNHKTFALQNNIWVDISSKTAYTTSSSTAEKIAILNPFRYRSYYFDTETGLYYLQSRYYDPETGRFISMDSIEYLDPESIHGLNLYAYCANNPVMAVDPSGQFALAVFLTCLIAGAILGGVTRGINAYNDGARGWDLVGQIAIGVGAGALIGGAVGVVAGLGGAFLLGGISATFSKFTTDLVAYSLYGTPIGTWEDYAVAFVFGGLTRGLFGKGFSFGGFAFDVPLRPLFNQFAKIGTGRQNEMNWSKYGYDLMTRALTYFMPKPWKSFARGITRGYWTLYGWGLPIPRNDGQFYYV